jgi:hypothetical protein
MPVDNESLVGRMGTKVGVDSAGFKAMRQELELASKVMGEGMLAGVAELATGGSKVKAVWESIKWGSMARLGIAGFAGMLMAANALTFGIRKIVEESGALQAAIDRVGQTKVATRQFAVFLGSVQEAKKRVSDLYAFVATSKFDFSQAATASRMLTVLTNGARGTRTDLEMLGRISTATGAPLEDLAEAVGRTTKAIKGGFDISGNAQQLREMGAITEEDVRHLDNLAQSGASTAAVMREFNSAVSRQSSAIGDTDKGIQEVTDHTEKQKEAMMAAFGTPFVDRHRKEVELAGKVYENLTPAIAHVGETLAYITTPFDRMRTVLKEIGASKAFGGLAKDMGGVLALVGPIVTGFFAMKGAGKAISSGFEALKKGGFIGPGGVGDRMFGGVFLGRQSGVMAARGARLRDVQKEELSVGNVAGARWAGASAKASELAAAGFGKMSEAAKTAGGAVSGMAGKVAAGAAKMGVIMLATYALDKWLEKVQKTKDQDLRLLNNSDQIKAETAALQEQIKTMKTRDDLAAVRMRARQNLSTAQGRQGEVYANRDSTDADREAADAAVAAAAKNMRRVDQIGGANLGAGSVEIENAKRQADIEREINQIIFDRSAERASSGEKALMYAAEEAKAQKRIADYEKGRAAQPGITRAQNELAAVGNDDEYNKRIKDLTASGDTEAVKRAVADHAKLVKDAEDALADALEGGSEAQRLEAAAMKTKNPKEASDLRLQASRITPEDVARQRLAQGHEGVRAAARQGITDTTATQLAAIRQDSYGAEDRAAATRLNGVTRMREELIKDGFDAQSEQIVALDNEATEIRNSTAMRLDARKREQEAIDTAVKVHELNNTALTEAAKGNFAAADAAQRAARDAQDAQTRRERTVELRGQGFGEAETATTVAREQAGREAERNARAAAFRTTETRRAQELELENAAHGRGVAPGQASGSAARLELKHMQDVDAFREQLGRNQEELGPGHAKEAADLAMRTVSAQILAQGGQPRGAGSMGDTLTAVGGGGGFYAGATADPQLDALNRIAKLAEDQNKILGEIKDKKVVVK